MRSFYFRILVFVGCFGFTLALQGQKVAFEASIDARQILLNEYTKVTFTLKNANGDRFQSPSFEGFRVLSGPSTGMSTTIVNGRRSSELSYSYLLQPTRVGKFTIGAASIVVDGKKLTSNVLSVEVVKGKAADESADAKIFFLKAEPSTTEAVVGQQVILDYKLYLQTKYRKNGLREVSESSYDDFYSEQLNWYRVFKEVIDGVQYTSWIVKRIALFPQKTGTLTIDPLQLQLDISDSNQPAMGFFSRPSERYIISSEPVEIQVSALPDGAPPSFSGAVGQYEFKASVPRTTITTDDALSVYVNFSGNGDQKRVTPPTLLVNSDSLEVYDPSVLREETREIQGTLRHLKEVEYLVVPKYPGEYQLPIAFSYYDPDSSRYLIRKATPYQVKVRPGANLRGEQARRQREKEKEAPEVQTLYPLKEKVRLGRKGETFVGSTLFYSLGGLPLLGLLGIFLYRQAQKRKQGIDPLLLKKQGAAKIAAQRLAAAENYLQAGDSKAFYNEVSRASLGYVSDKLHIPTSQLTKANVKEQLQQLQLPETSVEQFMKILQRCEMALFAGMDNSAAMKETYENASKVIQEMEESRS
jgi:hypothetical protein